MIERNNGISIDYSNREKLILLLNAIIIITNGYTPIVDTISLALILGSIVFWDLKTFLIIFPATFFLGGSYSVLSFQIIGLAAPIKILTVQKIVYLVYLVKYLIHIAKHRKISIINYKSLFILFVIFGYYIIFTLSDSYAVWNIIYLVVAYTSVILLKKDKILFKKFAFSLFVFGVVSGIYGLTHRFDDNLIWTSSTTSLERLSGINDPNFLAMYCNFGIFSLLGLELPLKKWFRISMIVFLYVLLFLTLSISGLLANFGGIILFFVLSLRKKLNYIKVLYIIFASIAVIGLTVFFIPLEYKEALAYRIDMAQMLLKTGDYSNLTSLRVDLASSYFKYYNSQTFFKQLIGGNYISEEFLEKSSLYYPSHNSFIDILLSHGSIGFIVILLYLVFSLWSYFKQARDKSNDREISITKTILKIVFIIESVTLSFYGNDLFFFFLFL